MTERLSGRPTCQLNVHKIADKYKAQPKSRIHNFIGQKKIILEIRVVLRGKLGFYGRRLGFFNSGGGFGLEFFEKGCFSRFKFPVILVPI